MEETADPCAALDPWLRSLAPRAELVARIALRARFNEMRRDKSFFRRIAQLTSELNLAGTDLNSVLEEAKAFARRLEAQSQPETVADR
jgi:hypothetical protein